MFMKKWLPIVCVIMATSLTAISVAQSAPDKPKSSRAMSQKVIASVNLYTDKQDATGAIKGLTEVLAKDPKNYYANAWMGYIKMEEGAYEDAVSPLRTAHEVMPNDIGVLTNLAFVLDKATDRKGAYDAYLELNKAKPGDPVVLNKLGVMEMESGQTEQAISRFEEADRVSPNDKMPTMNLAFAYEKAKDSDKARAAYERLVALNPDNETMMTSLSWL